MTSQLLNLRGLFFNCHQGGSSFSPFFFDGGSGYTDKIVIGLALIGYGHETKKMEVYCKDDP